jgi:uncharacterized protein (DUF362 family)
MDRRTFLGRAAVTTVALGGATALGWRLREGSTPIRWDDNVFPPPSDARVAVLRASSYDQGLEQLIADGLRSVGADVGGARVLLKPNLVEYDPGQSINTDPRIIGAAVIALRRLGAASVTVGEGPGHRRDTRYVVEASGLGEALTDVGAQFKDLNVDEAGSAPLHSWYTQLGGLWLPRSVTDADIVISMPKMKTHHWAGVTLSLKNLFGCLPGRVYGWPKNALHWAGIDGSILDIAGAVRPAYAIIDGIVGMEGNGPIDGNGVRAGVVVISDDPVAADTVATRLMGMDPGRVVHINEASRFLGQGDWSRIHQDGEDPDALVTAFAPPPGFDYLVA